ncbi:hypothetical protein MAMMFC1_01350 [Methylomusa anaerophila]|uniref:Uncharacterized protein n=1 Tax=Methylomusa anaerophila TaxID=1930071 RepID=A0A348AHZ1_9FIRM|nr:hypothetical protein MAMMFC1_01350 [Methylomusa anaerophila]
MMYVAEKDVKRIKPLLILVKKFPRNLKKTKSVSKFVKRMVQNSINV